MKHTKEENKLFIIGMIILLLIALFGKIEVKDEESYLANLADSVVAVLNGDSTWSDTLKEVKNGP